MDVNTIRIAATVAAFITFIGILAWTFHRGNRAEFDEAARIPFEREGGPDHE